MKTYITTRTIRRGTGDAAEMIGPNRRVEMDAADGDALVARGILREAPAPEAAPAVIKPQGPALMKAIAGAIATLDPENDEHFTIKGAPHTAVLAGKLGYPISAAERNTAFDLFRKENPDLFKE